MTPAVHPASGRPLPPVGAGRTTGAHRDRFPWRRPVGGGHGTRHVDAIWHEGRAELVRRQRGHASRLGGPGDGGDGVLPAAGDSRYVDPDQPAAHGWMVAVRAEGPGSATLVRLIAVESGRSVLPAANPDRPGAAPPVSHSESQLSSQKTPFAPNVEGIIAPFSYHFRSHAGEIRSARGFRRTPEVRESPDRGFGCSQRGVLARLICVESNGASETAPTR